MTFHLPPTEQQGYYKYDPTVVRYGWARIFPYGGEDGTMRYLMTELRRDLLKQGQVSQPLFPLFELIESGQRAIEESWMAFSTFFADVEVLHSGLFNFSLPPNEPFNTSFMRERRQILQITQKASDIATEQKKKAIAPLEKLKAQQLGFYQGAEQQGRKRPRVTYIYERDRGLSDCEFARQRIAGANPMRLKRILDSDNSLLKGLSSRTYALANSETVELGAAAAQNRLFVTDYSLFQNLVPGDFQSGRYVGPAAAVFYHSEQGLEPLLIQLEPKGKIFTPQLEYSVDEWMRAKLYVQVADAVYHEAIDHTAYTHFAMEPVTIATPRQLPSNHPLYRLINPHFRFLLPVNHRGSRILLEKGAAFDNLLPLSLDTTKALIGRAILERPFNDYALPDNISRRGVEQEYLPEFPYRDDAQLLWSAIYNYVSSYLSRYYLEDRAVLQDRYVQAWASELGTPLNQRPITDFPQAPAWLPEDLKAKVGMDYKQLPSHPRLPGFPAKIASVQQLVDIAATIIFTCAPQHSALNYAQFDYLGCVDNLPLSASARPDVNASLEKILPTPEMALQQMQITFLLSGIYWGCLGNSELIEFREPGDIEILQQFQAELKKIEHEINLRNQKRQTKYGVDYPYLLPSQIPNSLNL